MLKFKAYFCNSKPFLDWEVEKKMLLPRTDPEILKRGGVRRAILFSHFSPSFNRFNQNFPIKKGRWQLSPLCSTYLPMRCYIPRQDNVATKKWMILLPKWIFQRLSFLVYFFSRHNSSQLKRGKRQRSHLSLLWVQISNLVTQISFLEYL